RCYVHEKLIESGEFETIARRHAQYCLRMLEQVEATSAKRPAERLAVFNRHIDDTRAALDWAFSPRGDAALGVRLTIPSLQLWLQLSLIEELRERVERALASVERDRPGGARQEMQLCAALGAAGMFRQGSGLSSHAAYIRTLEIAESLDDAEYQLRALRGLCNHEVRCGEFRSAKAFAGKFECIAASFADPEDRLTVDRLVGTVLHYTGDHARARRTFEHMLRAPAVPEGVTRCWFDQRVVARSILARTLWLQGFPEQALRTAQDNVEQALAAGHEMSVC